MKEAFETRRLTGSINVRCKYDDGTERYWTDHKENVIKRIVAIVTEYRRLGYKLTLRQLHYQMVSHDPKYVNHDTAYKKLGLILDDCRYAGVIDWDAIEDRGRRPHLLYSADSIEDAIMDMRRYYRRNRQQDQDEIVELWTEKDALSGILQRSTEKYHVRLCVNKGYTSSSAIYGAYERILDYLTDGKHVTILYFGDHDPSGLDMVRDIRDRLYFMLSNGREQLENPEELLDIVAIGLTIQQVQQYNLPPNPTKLTDTRANGYIQLYGTTCWEVDALDPQTLTALVEANIRRIIDVDQYADIVAEEKTELAKIARLATKLKDIDLSGEDDEDTEEDDEDTEEDDED